MRAYMIRCNREQVFFDAELFDVGELKLADGTCGEQCEGCGADIVATGQISGKAVTCCSCGASYAARPDHLQS